MKSEVCVIERTNLKPSCEQKKCCGGLWGKNASKTKNVIANKHTQKTSAPFSMRYKLFKNIFTTCGTFTKKKYFTNKQAHEIAI